jgi:hypothetical protein
MSEGFIRTGIKIVPWMLLIHNLFYLVIGNTVDGKSGDSLALSNVIGLAFLIIMRWAINNGYVSAYSSRWVTI